MTKVFDTGSFKDLEALRDKYQMPMMPWIDSEEDFKAAKQYFNVENEYQGKWRGRGCW